MEEFTAEAQAVFFVSTLVDAANFPNSGDDGIISCTSQCTRRHSLADFRLAGFDIGLNEAQRAQEVMRSFYHSGCPTDQDVVFKSSVGMYMTLHTYGISKCGNDGASAVFNTVHSRQLRTKR